MQLIVNTLVDGSLKPIAKQVENLFSDDDDFCGKDPFISREGGMTIFCTCIYEKCKTEIANFKNQEVIAWLKPVDYIKYILNKDEPKGLRVKNVTFLDDGILFTFLPMCYDQSKIIQPFCTLVQWNDVKLVLAIDGDSNEYLVAGNIRPEMVNKWTFEQLEPQLEPQDINKGIRRSYWKMLKGNEINGLDLEPDKTYMTLWLYVANVYDSTAIKRSIEYLKDHLTIVFKYVSPSGWVDEVNFISKENMNNRKRMVDNGLTTNATSNFQAFNAIYLVHENNGLHYKIIMPYNSILWKEFYVMFQIGETDDKTYPMPIGKPQMISEIKIKSQKMNKTSTGAILVIVGVLFAAVFWIGAVFILYVEGVEICRRCCFGMWKIKYNKQAESLTPSESNTAKTELTRLLQMQATPRSKDGILDLLTQYMLYYV